MSRVSIAAIGPENDEIRQRLLRSTRKLLRTKWAKSLSVADAARAAGVPQATAYRRFNKASELIAEAMKPDLEELERLRALIDVWCEARSAATETVNPETWERLAHAEAALAACRRSTDAPQTNNS